MRTASGEFFHSGVGGGSILREGDSVHHKASTLKPKPQTLNPKPSHSGPDGSIPKLCAKICAVAGHGMVPVRSSARKIPRIIIALVTTP